MCVWVWVCGCEWVCVSVSVCVGGNIWVPYCDRAYYTCWWDRKINLCCTIFSWKMDGCLKIKCSSHTHTLLTDNYTAPFRGWCPNSIADRDWESWSFSEPLEWGCECEEWGVCLWGCVPVAVTRAIVGHKLCGRVGEVDSTGCGQVTVEMDRDNNLLTSYTDTSSSILHCSHSTKIHVQLSSILRLQFKGAALYYMYDSREMFVQQSSITHRLEM